MGAFRVPSRLRVLHGGLLQPGAVIDMQGDRILVENEDGDYFNFAALVKVNYEYPTTALQWQPGTASSFAWPQKPLMVELLATTGHSLRVF